MNWKPMETAPQDGTEILVWIPHASDFERVRHHHVRGWMHFAPNEWGDLNWRPLADYEQPTHWMPLPEKP